MGLIDRLLGRKEDEMPEAVPETVADTIPVKPDKEPIRPQLPITEDTVAKGIELLQKYKSGKQHLEQRLIEDEEWWELRHWEVIRRGKEQQFDSNGKPVPELPRPTSAWLFNAITSKHADAMDNYPEPQALPREKSDEQSAKMLTEILPVVLDRNGFKKTYSDNWWEKLKHGTAAYFVYWDNKKEHIGDIGIARLDMLNLYWEPGIEDLEQSANIFITTLVDIDRLKEQYPDVNVSTGNAINAARYNYQENIDTTDKAVVVDWYYKKMNAEGKATVQYIKFAGSSVLYASENDAEYAENGFYDHGKYPVILDVLYPEKGTPAGFGLIAICKDPQLYIDALAGDLLTSARMSITPRWIMSESTAANEEDFLDWSKPIVKVAGELGDERIRQIIVQPPSAMYTDLMDQKITEMKETSFNRDFTTGSTASGVTSGAAIAALQEAGNKASRDMIDASYLVYTKIMEMCIELMRQFYTEARPFRIVAPNGFDYQMFSNQMLQQQIAGVDSFGNQLIREPVFDIKIKAMKKSPFSRMEENERAKELYQMGFFNPQRAQEALGALEMMNFEGIEKVRDRVQQGETLLNLLQQYQMLIAQLTGQMGMPMQAPGAPQGGAPGQAPGQDSMGMGEVMESQSKGRTPYMERLAKNSKPDINAMKGANV
jgi:hypothetical protein